MVKKLFGQTSEEQFKYLKPRLTALGVGVALLLIGSLLAQMGVSFGNMLGNVGSYLSVIVLLIFGWSIMRGLFGFTSVGALFSGNVIIGVVIFVLFLIIGYLGGIFAAIIGLCRFFVLLKERKGNE